MKSLFSALILLAVAISACHSESDPGEECDEPAGTEGVCAVGTVCGVPSRKSGILACVTICSKDPDCGKGYECKDAVDGARIKGCRFKD